MTQRASSVPKSDWKSRLRALPASDRWFYRWARARLLNDRKGVSGGSRN